MKKVIAIIPAHNEEESINRALQSLVQQTYPFYKIIIALDNCNDSTKEIVQSYSVRFNHLYFFETYNNKNKKAGALNQAYKHINIEYDYLLQMDADSFLATNFIKEGIELLETNKKLGGICSRFRIKDFNKGNYLLYLMQDIEYSMFDSIQIEKNMNTHVLSGTASLFRKEALIKYEKPWNENSLVEDYALTLKLKKDGWQIKAGRNNHIKTDYMKTLKELWN